MKKIIGVVFLFLSATIVAGPLSFVEAAIVEPGFETETVAGGFTLPTAMAFAPDGRIFIAEKGGTVRVIKNGALLPTPVITLTDINTFGDRGLIGIAVDPNFSSNKYLYLSYTYENTPGSNFSGQKTGRIVRVTVSGDTASESSKVVIVGTVGGNAATPSCDNYPKGTDCIPSDSMSHSVGGLRFGPDGKLYATFGDGANFDIADPRSLRAQDLDNLAGKVIRINTDGAAPSTNPFYTGDQNANRSKVYAYGMRNAFRFNFQPTTGLLFLGDVGWSNWEEINRVIAGGNYGWPCYEGVGATSHNCTASGATNPTYTYGHDLNGAGSVTAGSFPSNGAYPAAYNNSFFFGDYAQNWIKRMVIDTNNNVVSVNDFMDNPDGPVDVSTGPDGNIYYLSIYTGELHRLTHTTGNRRPVPLLSATPTSGLAPLSVNFTSTGSYDPDGDPITFSWNFGDGAISNSANPNHEYVANGTYAPTLTVTDSNGSIATISGTVTVGNQKPTPEITSPGSGSLFTPGSQIELSGAATDGEDGILGASAFHWQIILHHNTHIHIVQEFNGVTNPSFGAPDHGSSDIYVEVILTVTDSGGLSDTRSINLYANTGTGSGNLITNPSLETPDVVPGTPFRWVKGGFGVNSPLFAYPVSGFDGASAAKVEITSYTNGNAKWYFDPVFVSPGNEYVLTHYYTANVPTPITAQLGFSNGTYQYVELATVPPETTATLTEQHIVIPAGVQTLTVFHELNQVGTLTVDNYSLTLATPAGDTISPSVSITSPTEASALSGATTVSVNASDSVGVAGVTLTVDGNTLGAEDVSAPYDFLMDTTVLPDGAHVIGASARDAAGNVGVATPVNVTVTNTAGAVNLIQNADLETQNAGNPVIPVAWTPSAWGDHVTVFTYPITGYNALKAARVEITNYPANGTGDAKWFFDPIAVTPGTAYTYKDHYRSNTISDIIGRYTLSDGSFHYFGLAKEIQPNTSWQTISATFTPPAGATHVTFFHLISAAGFVEIDDVELYAAGAGTPSETNVPIVEFTNPLQGQTVSGIVNITASSTDDTAVTYIFYAVDGIPVTGQITTPPYSFNWDSTTVSNGPHILKATTHDPSGNNSTNTITVTVNNTAPPPPPSNNLIQNPSLETAGISGNPENWFRGGWGTNDPIFTYPALGVDGAKAAKVEITNYTNGDAKWYFTDIPVTAGGVYTFTHEYRSNAQTNMTVRYTKTDGTVQYVSLRNLAAAPDWIAVTETLTIPAGIVSLTLFHSLISAGWLEVDKFSLVTGNLDTFTRGMVSLTFDDGWISHYTDALPILTAEGVKGTFYIVSEETAGAVPDERIQNPSLETAGVSGDPENWFRGGWGTNDRAFTYPITGVDGAKAAKVEIINYTNGDAKWYFGEATVIPNTNYTLKDSYNSDINSEVVIRYTLQDSTVQYIFLSTLPGTGGTWQNFERTITTPVNVTSMTLFHVIANVGSLVVDNYSLKRVQVYVDPAQMLAIQSAGHELGGHSKTHPDLTTLGAPEQQDQIVGSRASIIGMGGTPVDTFAYPFGGYNAAIQTLTQNAGYVAARGVDRGYNVKTTDKYALKVQQVNRMTTLSEVQAWANQAAQDKSWLILMFHQIDANLLENLGATPEMLQQIIDYIKTADVDIVKMRDGVSLMTP